MAITNDRDLIMRALIALTLRDNELDTFVCRGCNRLFEDVYEAGLHGASCPFMKGYNGKEDQGR